LTLTASKKVGRKKEVYSHDTRFGYRVLRAAAVYGANASGKSKLFEAFNYLKLLLSGNKDKNGQYQWKGRYDTFRLSTETCDKPIAFELVFVLDDNQYRYGIAVYKETINEEYLYVKENIRESCVFVRNNDNTIKYNSRFGRKGNMLIRNNFIKIDVPFLTILNDSNDDLGNRIMEYINHIIVISSTELPDIAKHVINDDLGVKSFVLKFLKNFDISIDDISAHEISVDEIPQKIKSMIGEDNLDGKWFDGVNTSHKVYNEDHEVSGKTNLIMERDESYGTNKLFNISLPLIMAIKMNSPILIDEFDSGIHPNILKELISMFYLPENKAQLIINTQNSSLMAAELPSAYEPEDGFDDYIKDNFDNWDWERPLVAESKTKFEPHNLFYTDQVYFVSKNRYGESSLTPLSDYKGEKDLRSNLERLYLDNRLEGTPMINTDKLINLIKEEF